MASLAETMGSTVGFHGPIDGEVGVVPAQSALGGRGIRTGARLADGGFLLQGEKSMGQASRQKQAFEAGGIEIAALPAAVSRRRSSQINHDVINAAGGQPEEFGLRVLAALEMESAEGSAMRGAAGDL